MTAIVCVSQSWGIGRDGALLFRISADHKRFRTLTVGKTVGDDAIVIGGASVYMALLSRCDRVYVTKVDADPDADSFFPNLDDNPDWRIESESETFEENGLKFRYVDYVRK